MASIETSPDSARSDLSMKYLFTSKNLTHRQKLYRWVVIGCWVVMGYACVAVIVFNDDWGQWRFYGGFAAMGLPLLVLFFSLRFVWALLRRLVLVAVGRVGSSPAGGRRRGVWLGRSWDSGSLGVSCGWSATSRSCTSGPMWRMRARGVCVMRMSSARTFTLGEVLERTRMRNMFLTW